MPSYLLVAVGVMGFAWLIRVQIRLSEISLYEKQGDTAERQESMKTDVIVVGGGLAGILAVYGAQSEGAKVTLIDRGSIGIGTNSALAGGLFRARPLCMALKSM